LRIPLVDPETVKVSVRPVLLAAGLDAGVHFHQYMRSALMDVVGSWAFLQAAALDDRGGGLVFGRTFGTREKLPRSSSR
jgi:hypothetical protein